jgi:hypothetical protein
MPWVFLNKLEIAMIRLITFLSIHLFLTIPSVLAQDDPFDLSAREEQTEGLGVTTISQVSQLEERARELYGAENCDEAVDVLDELSRRSNVLANFIRRGLEPFYDASRDEREGFGSVRQLIPFETLANSYTRKRNIAMVMRAECFVKIGDDEKAAGLFYQALNLIDIDNSEWWDRARSGLYTLIEVPQ